MVPSNVFVAPTSSTVVASYEAASRIPKGVLGCFARHSVALFFYALCFLQHPSSGLAAHAAPEYKRLASIMSTTHFVFLVWTAMLHHYLTTGGRVEYDKSWRITPKGWLIVVSPILHTAMTLLTLSSACITIFNSIAFELIMREFITENFDDKNDDILCRMILIKLDVFLCVLLALYSIFRICVDPIMRKSTIRNCKKGKIGESEASLDVIPKPDECSICHENWANRKLFCGHVLCCCCLGEIAKLHEQLVTCPFCRAEVLNARRLAVVVQDKVNLMECCKLDDEPKPDLQGQMNHKQFSTVISPLLANSSESTV